MTRFPLPAAAVLSLVLSSTALADLRTFDVDPQYQQEVFAALRRILTPDEGRIPAVNGRVEQLPSGQILVNADAATLEQVEKVLQAMRARSAAATPRAALRYWAVLGTAPGERTANAPRQPAPQVNVTVGSNTSAPPAPPPPMLNGVLEELSRIHGNLTFRVLGSAAIATNSGQRGEADGWPLSVGQTVHVEGGTLNAEDRLNAEIDMQLTGMAPNTVGNSPISNLSVRTSLRRGEFVVLGESYVVFANGDRGPVFYIVHWEK